MHSLFLFPSFYIFNRTSSLCFLFSFQMQPLTCPKITVQVKEGVYFEVSLLCHASSFITCTTTERRRKDQPLPLVSFLILSCSLFSLPPIVAIFNMRRTLFFNFFFFSCFRNESLELLTENTTKGRVVERNTRRRYLLLDSMFMYRKQVYLISPVSWYTYV